MKKRQNELKTNTPQLHSATLNITPEVFVLTLVSPCHPCFNALWITDNPLCTFYSLSDVIFQQSAAGYPTGVNCSWGFAIIAPPPAIDLKYPIISAFVSTIVVCSTCVVIAFPSGQTHPVCQADSPIAIQSESLQSSGKLTPLKFLALDSNRKEEKPQNKESLHVD